jgi:predicted RNA-binding Zn ribbon-like protein
LNESVKMSRHDHPTAPGDLALVHAFLNTTIAASARERFDTPDRMQDWLAKRSLMPSTAPISPGEFETVLTLRNALRALLASSDDQVRRKQLDMINSIVERAPLIVRFDDPGTPRLLPGQSGISGAIAQILTAIIAGQAEGAWSRMKLCRNPECQRVFYDTSKNHSAVWCSSRQCGNRMAARAYRARQGAGTGQ